MFGKKRNSPTGPLNPVNKNQKPHVGSLKTCVMAIFLSMGLSSSVRAQNSTNSPPMWPVVKCSEGHSLFHFKLEATPALPSGTVVTYGSHQLLAAHPGGDDLNTQLTVCISADSESVFLKRILFTREPFTHWTPPSAIIIRADIQDVEWRRESAYRLIEVPESKVQVVGLHEAMFGDARRLRVVVPLEQADRELKILGFQHNNRTFVGSALWITRPDQSTWLPLEPLQAGYLVPGESFQSHDCPAGEGRLNWLFEFEKVSLTVDACWHQIGVSGRSFNLREARLIDRSEWLSTTEQGPIIIRGDHDQLFRYKTTHHNECDSFVIRLPHATYGFTIKNLPDELCPEVLEGAPNFSGTMPRDHGFQYQVQYQNDRILGGTSTIQLPPNP